MALYTVNVTTSAKNDLNDVFLYIAVDLLSPETAEKIIIAIEEAVKSLSYMPHKHALVDDERLAAMGYRKLVIKNYITFFTIEEEAKTVNVKRILYARRNWLHIL